MGVGRETNKLIHTFPQGSSQRFIPHTAVRIKGVDLYKASRNKDYTDFTIEADSLGVVGLYISIIRLVMCEQTLWGRRFTGSEAPR